MPSASTADLDLKIWFMTFLWVKGTQGRAADLARNPSYERTLR